MKSRILSEISSTAQTAQSAQKQKSTKFIWVFIVIGIYNFGFQGEKWIDFYEKLFHKTLSFYLGRYLVSLNIF